LTAQLLRKQRLPLARGGGLWVPHLEVAGY